MGLFITPAVAAHRPHQDANQQQVQQDDNLPQNVVHQMQRRKFRYHRPEVQRQQRQADAHNLASPVAGQLGRHIEVAYRHTVFFQHFPAQAEDQPEQRQLLAEGPQQIADVELHGQQDQPRRQYQQAHRHGADQIDKDGFRGMKLTVVTQLPHFICQLRLVLSQPAETPADQASNQQQRQTGQERNCHRRACFFPVNGDFHRFNLVFQHTREGFNPVPVHRFVAVNPEDLLGQDLLQAFGNAHQLLLVDLQVDGHHQLVAELFVQLIQQLTTHIHHLQQRLVDFIIHIAGVPFFYFGDKGIALEHLVALLVDLKLFKTQVRDAVGHILQLIGRR
ncbi:hypothetical protein D3C75_468870 [compost metagenome]